MTVKEANVELLLDVEDFRSRILPAYASGRASRDLEADDALGRSLVPPGTGALRDFSHLAAEVPLFIADKCIGCMECVNACPDTAILGKALPEDVLNESLTRLGDQRQMVEQRANWTKTRKYFDIAAGKGQAGAFFGIFVDPTKCKGCGECVEVCGTHNALEMVKKDEGLLERTRRSFAFYQSTPETPAECINEKSLGDFMLAERSLLYTGGAGSCMGCGEATALRMMLAATGFIYGRENIGIVNATGCSSVYASTYPYNPYKVTWTNSLFENAPADAMGVRLRWDQQGWQRKRLWVVGGDGAMLDIGFGSLSRMLMSGLDIKVLVLDTQVYSNTGGQASTSSFEAQDSKMASFGSSRSGKSEHRKELGTVAMMHPGVFVAQTITADPGHFYRAIMAANDFPGPAVVSVYTTCQPEHGVADNLAAHQARLARDTRTFPVFIYDPRQGERMRERLSLRGNPAMREDWTTDPKTKERLDFVAFARTEGRFARQFDAGGNPSEALLKAQQDRLAHWRLLRELAGMG
ncbi:MAG: thiamine pyrophosphate-binding protein [Anaerolinea sp.]|nr:thiamine pyrophosphate-binding protein [Anaerolinea sp.]